MWSYEPLSIIKKFSKNLECNSKCFICSLFSLDSDISPNWNQIKFKNHGNPKSKTTNRFRVLLLVLLLLFAHPRVVHTDSLSLQVWGMSLPRPAAPFALVIPAAPISRPPARLESL